MLNTLTAVPTMLGIRLADKLEKELVALAQRQGRTKSEVAREAIRIYVERHALAQEAHRQSLLVAAADDADIDEFVSQAASVEGWQ